MLSEDFVTAFNSRIAVNVNTIKTMKTEQLDRVRAQGNAAEELMKNRDLAQFVHATKIELLDQLSAVVGHTEEDNNRRVAIGNQLAGLETFVDTLKRAVYNRNLVVKQMAQGSAVPTDII